MSKKDPRKASAAANGASENSPTASGPKPKHFSVERVLDKRVRNGQTEYFLKWRNFSIAESTWEPVEHLNCSDLINKFEEKLKEEKALRKIREIEFRPLRLFKTMYCVEGMKQLLSGLQSDELDSITLLDQLEDAIHLPLVPQRILGINRSSPSMYFVVKFLHSKEPIFVHPNVLYNRWPMLACRFYEEWINAHYDSDCHFK